MEEQSSTPETPVFEPGQVVESAPRLGSWAGRIVIAVMAVALIAGAIAVTQDDGDSADTALQPLALALGGSGSGRSSNEAGAAADMMMVAPMEYRLEGELPDLGSTAPVYRLVQAELTADEVAAMAAAAGVEGTPQQADGGWLVDSPDGSLSVYPAPGSWSVNYSPYSMAMPDVPVSDEPQSEPGSAGSGGGVDGVSDPALTEDAAAAADAEARAAEDEKVASEDEGDTPVPTIVDDPILVDPMPINPDAEPSLPANVPSATDAEQIARDLLDAMGVLDGSEWTVTVTDSGMMGYGTACAEAATSSSGDAEPAEPVDCADDHTEVVTSRSVMFARQVDGVTVSGLEWSVDVGDKGTVQFVFGTLADLEDLGDYPLQSTQAVYDQLVTGDGYGYGGGPVPMGDDIAISSGGAASDIVVGTGGIASDNAGDLGATTIATYDDGTCTASDTDGDGVMDSESCTGFVGECPPDTNCIVPDPGICDDPAADCSVPPVEPCTREAGADCVVPVPDECVDGEECSSPPSDGCVDGEECIPTEPPGVCADGEECIQPLPPECDPAVADCGIIEPMPEPEPTVVVVTGAERSAQVIWGTDAGVDVQYLVPSYRFLGHFADGSEWSADLVALDESMVIGPEVPDTTVPPETVPPETVPETTVPDDTTPTTEPTVGTIPDNTTPDDTIVCTEAPCDDPTTTVTIIEEPPGTIVCVTTPCNDTVPPGEPVTTIPADTPEQ